MLLLVSAALAGDCPNLGQAINGISVALNDVDLDTARALSLDATASLECQSKPVSAITMTSLFQLAGSVELYMGETDAAQEFFERAVAVSPLAQIDPLLGEDAEAVYGTVRQQILDTPGGMLRVEGQIQAWLDGRPLAPGADIDVVVGNHLLQWRETDEAPLQARVVRVASREGRVLPLGAQTVTSAAAPAATGGGGASGGASKIAVVGGGIGGVVIGGVLVGMAGLSHLAFNNETDPAELGAHQLRTNMLTVSGLAVGALGLGVAGVGVVLLEDGAGLTWSRRW